MSLQFPNNTKSVKDGIRAVIGQTVTFVLRDDYTACPVCSGADYYDSVNETSLNSWCTTCSGRYWIVTEVNSGIIAHVNWRVGDEPEYGVAGESFGGDCSITIDINALTEGQITNIREIIADSRKLEPFRMHKRGVPTRDRYRFTCRETGKES